MQENNELVIIEMPTGERIRLYSQITGRMQELGFTSLNYSELNLGFELPLDWPCEPDNQPTLAQLVVIANKLKMKITITNLYIEPHRERTPNESRIPG